MTSSSLFFENNSSEHWGSRFRAPLRSCDKFTVDVRVGAATAARLVLEQQIVRLAPDQPPQVTMHIDSGTRDG